MLSLSRWFKFSLPVATATTATVVTVLLITLSKVDPLKLFDIQDKELDDFELKSKTFEDEIVKEKGPDLEIQELSSDAPDPKEPEDTKQPVNIDSEEKNLEKELPKGEEPEVQESLSQENQPNDAEDLSRHELSIHDRKEIEGPENGKGRNPIESFTDEAESISASEVPEETNNIGGDQLDSRAEGNSDSPKVEEGADQLNQQSTGDDPDSQKQGTKATSPKANGQAPNKVFNSDEIGNSNVTDGGQGSLDESDLVFWKEELENSVNVLFQLRAVTEKDLF